MRFNYGHFRNGVYTKRVRFSKAVIWKDRQLSLREEIIDRIRDERIQLIVFVDEGKNERWIFKTDNVFESMVKKSVGQEVQYYFPIELAKRVEIEKLQPRPSIVYDNETNTAYIGAVPAKIEDKVEVKKRDPQIGLF